MSAAEVLRGVLEAAGNVAVEVSEEHDLLLGVNGKPIVEAYTDDERAAMRLISLLVVAAPHLADLLDGSLPLDEQITARRSASEAVTEADEAMTRISVIPFR